MNKPVILVFKNGNNSSFERWTDSFPINEIFMELPAFIYCGPENVISAMGSNSDRYSFDRLPTKALRKGMNPSFLQSYEKIVELTGVHSREDVEPCIKKPKDRLLFVPNFDWFICFSQRQLLWQTQSMPMISRFLQIHYPNPKSPCIA